MGVPDDLEGLRFACECVSARRGGYSEPWAAIAKNRLLLDGTKEEILNLVAREPKTVSQLAEALKLSPPSVHTHITDMLKSELLRESEEWEKRYPTERYYEPNFPVIRADEALELCAICQDLAEQMAGLFKKRRRQFEKAFRATALAERGWEFAEVAQFLFAKIQRNARVLLEQDGILAPRTEHGNGVEWVFWAEEPSADANE
jgi:DNA-binding transcriptional ArsR family regulator